MRSLWTRVALLSIGLAAACWLPWVQAQAPKPGATEQRIFLVVGNDPWKETDVVIRPGDKVTFKGAGKACFSGGAPDSCQKGPAGWPRNDYDDSWPDDYNECEDPLPDAGHASLIGSIGGSVFHIGPTKTITDMEGELKLGINDCTFEGPHGNSGEFSVVVSIGRARPPK